MSRSAMLPGSQVPRFMQRNIYRCGICRRRFYGMREYKKHGIERHKKDFISSAMRRSKDYNKILEEILVAQHPEFFPNVNYSCIPAYKVTSHGSEVTSHGSEGHKSHRLQTEENCAKQKRGCSKDSGIGDHSPSSIELDTHASEKTGSKTPLLLNESVFFEEHEQLSERLTPRPEQTLGSQAEDIGVNNICGVNGIEISVIDPADITSLLNMTNETITITAVTTLPSEMISSDFHTAGETGQSLLNSSGSKSTLALRTTNVKNSKSLAIVKSDSIDLLNETMNEELSLVTNGQGLSLVECSNVPQSLFSSAGSSYLNGETFTSLSSASPPTNSHNFSTIDRESVDDIIASASPNETTCRNIFEQFSSESDRAATQRAGHSKGCVVSHSDIEYDEEPEAEDSGISTHSINFQTEFAKFLTKTTFHKDGDARIITKETHVESEGYESMPASKGLRLLSQSAASEDDFEPGALAAHEAEKRKRRSKRYVTQQLQLERLRASFMNVVNIVFPNIRFPKYFRSNSEGVDVLIDQLLTSVTGYPPTRSVQVIPWTGACCKMRVTLCRDPGKCLRHLRKKIVRFLSCALPNLELGSNFDMTGNAVEQLLDYIFKCNASIDVDETL